MFETGGDFIKPCTRNITESRSEPNCGLGELLHPWLINNTCQRRAVVQLDTKETPL